MENGSLYVAFLKISVDFQLVYSLLQMFSAVILWGLQKLADYLDFSLILCIHSASLL